MHLLKSRPRWSRSAESASPESASGADRGGRGNEPGTVIEISTPKGMAYAQYALTERLGDLIRVLPGVFSERPASLAELVSAKERFWVFFPLRAALSRKLVSKAAHVPLPEHARTMPMMRMAGGRDLTGVLDWWLYDGEREWRIGKELTPEQQDMSIVQLINDTRLIEYIVEEWTPRREI